jgi:hypothetical protein
LNEKLLEVFDSEAVETYCGRGLIESLSSFMVLPIDSSRLSPNPGFDKLDDDVEA